MKSKNFWIEVNDDIDEIGESSDDYFSSGLEYNNLQMKPRIVKLITLHYYYYYYYHYYYFN